MFVCLFICLSVLVPSPDLDEDTKRWLVVGICIHSVISPALRQYVKPFVEQAYKNAQQTHGIKTQTYQNCLERYPSTNKFLLNYESVNKNKQKYGIKKNKKKTNNMTIKLQTLWNFQSYFCYRIWPNIQNLTQHVTLRHSLRL